MKSKYIAPTLGWVRSSWPPQTACAAVGSAIAKTATSRTTLLITSPLSDGDGRCAPESTPAACRLLAGEQKGQGRDGGREACGANRAENERLGCVHGGGDGQARRGRLRRGDGGAVAHPPPLGLQAP